MRNESWRLVLLVISAMLMLCPAARAGGPEDYLLKSEIKMKYLEQYAYRLDLSLAQWVAVQELHLEYRKRYRALREEEITPWLTNFPRNSSTFAEAAKAGDAFNDKLKYFRQKMAGFDDELFLKIEAILSETQLERMPRVRDHRRRQFTYLDMGLVPRGGRNHGVLDLGDIIHSMTLTRAEEEALDPILALQCVEADTGDRVLDYICQEMGGHFVRQEGFDDAAVNAVKECAEAIAAISDGQVNEIDLREIREAISALSSLMSSIRDQRDRPSG